MRTRALTTAAVTALTVIAPVVSAVPAVAAQRAPVSCGAVVADYAPAAFVVTPTTPGAARETLSFDPSGRYALTAVSDRAVADGRGTFEVLAGKRGAVLALRPLGSAARRLLTPVCDADAKVGALADQAAGGGKQYLRQPQS